MRTTVGAVTDDPRPLAPDPTRSERGECLPKADRVRSRRDYVAIQRNGFRVHTGHFLVVMLPDSGQRLGITVTRRIAGAVGRNRIKRLMREVFRRNRDLFPTHSAIVVVARKGADTLDYERVRQEMAQARLVVRRASSERSRGGAPRKRGEQDPGLGKDRG